MMNSPEMLDVFVEVNKKGKIPWGERSKLIKKHFPASAQLDWFEIFRQDPAIAGKIIGDIIKLDQERDGRPGKRPSLSEDMSKEKLRQLAGEDFSDYEFTKAFRILCGDRSVRAVANKVGLAPTRVHQLLHGEVAPTTQQMEQIAKGFKKKPSYFVEYRIAYIVATIAYKLETIPETSTILYKKLAGRNERGQ
jgi:transcriptional regulator with XRE-family HTH domain